MLMLPHRPRAQAALDVVVEQARSLDRLRTLAVERMSDAASAFGYAARAFELAPAEEDGLDGIGGRQERARDDLFRGSIATHRVDGDANLHALRSRSFEWLDLTTAVGSAGRANVMRPLRLMALRALDDSGRRELVRRAPLVAAGLRGFSLGDCHGRG